MAWHMEWVLPLNWVLVRKDRQPWMADMQGGILLSSETVGIFHSLEVDIVISYRLLGPVHTHEMTGRLVKISPTGVYFDVKRKDPFVNGDMMDVHLHIPSILGVHERPVRMLAVAQIVSCQQLEDDIDIYGCYCYRSYARFCQRPRWVE